MRYSKLFGKTMKDTPRDVVLASHKLLYRAGFIRESTAGRYYLLPLGIRVQQKIRKIIKTEMDKAGAQEMVTPVLHPVDLWKETNRTESVGFELMVIKDRNQNQFVLGGTAEEMLVDLVRKFQISYKDLPFNLYQFSTKFRDEARARGGLLRVREFTMKDAYSFDKSEEDFRKEYKKMEGAYRQIFQNLALDTVLVESDNGYIGGEYCHEFIVESDAGESKFLMTEDGKYAAHIDVARFSLEAKNLSDTEKPLQEIEAARGRTMEDGVKFHNLPLWQQIKDVLFVDEKGRFLLAIIRGDLDVNETKLMHIVKAYTLRSATDREIREVIHSEPGFLSPVGIKDLVEKDATLVVVADDSLNTIKNAYGGANRKHQDFLNINKGRDYTADLEGDIATAEEGYLSPGGIPLIGKKGIEVGNIFQLGFHYSLKMKDANFVDETGKKQPYYMGCYGIGLERTMAAIVEIHHDDKGIIWPAPVAPFMIHLIGLDLDDKATKEEAERVYEILQRDGIETLFDDRAISAGEKFADADLMGIPCRVVVSKKTAGRLEVKKRHEKNTEYMDISELKMLVTGG